MINCRAVWVSVVFRAWPGDHPAGGLMAAGKSVTYAAAAAGLLACAVLAALARMVARAWRSGPGRGGLREVAAGRLFTAQTAGIQVTGSRAGVFVSYSRSDKDFVRRLDERLAASGRRVWVDWQDIAPAAPFRAEIFAGIESAEAFVFVMSPASLTSSVCAEELRHAFVMNKRVVPATIAGVDRSVVPAELATLNWVSFVDKDDFEASFAALLRAVDTDLDWVKAHTRLTVQALEWEGKADKSLLLRGAELEAAEHAIADRPAKPAPTATQSRFVLASRRANTRRRRSAVVVSFAIVVAVAVLASLASVRGARAREQARTAQSRQLAARARLELDVDPVASLLLATRAYDEKATPEAESVLRQAIVDSREGSILRGNGQQFQDAAFSPDGRRIVSVGLDGAVRVWSSAEGSDPLVLHGNTCPPILGPLPLQGALGAVAFSPDGLQVVTGGFDGTVRVWALASGQEVAKLGCPPPGTGSHL